MTISVDDETDGYYGANVHPLKKKDMGQEQGNSFGYFDRLLYGFDPVDGVAVDYSDWEARDLFEMFGRDYKSKQIDNVLSLPILSAERSITPAKGDKGEAEWLQAFWDADPLNGGCKTSLEQITGQMTSAFSYKRSYMEKVWEVGQGDFAGKNVYDKVAWRPQTTCRLRRDVETGKFLGFEQEAYWVGVGQRRGTNRDTGSVRNRVSNLWPNKIEAKNAFVYIHGTRRDPINGVSDMEIAYWAWKAKQKIILLWCQFLEGVALPRTVVFAPEAASTIAGQVAELRNSGVLGIDTPDPTKILVSVLNMSGEGAAQFTSAIKWFDSCATESVLAGFLDLTSNASSGSGPVGVHLAADASDFYLQSLEAKKREMEFATRKDLFAPLIRHNFGPKAHIPLYEFEPLNAEDKTSAIELLQAMMAGRDPAAIPTEFIALLAEQVANYLGMDGTVVHDAFVKAGADAAAAAAQQAAQMATQMGQQVATNAGAVNAATKMVKTAKTPTKATAAPAPAAKPPPPAGVGPVGPILSTPNNSV